MINSSIMPAVGLPVSDCSFVFSSNQAAGESDLMERLNRKEQRSRPGPKHLALKSDKKNSCRFSKLWIQKEHHIR
jgi:hypothetical protein